MMRSATTRALTAAMALVVAAVTASSPTAAQGEAQEKSAQEQTATAESPRVIEVTILGMSCPFCAYGAEQKLKKLEGVIDLDIVLETGIATLTLEEGADIPNETLQKTVKEAGFEVAKIHRSFESEYPDLDAGDEGESS